MNFLKQSHLALVLILCAVIWMMANVSLGRSSSGVTENATQDNASLDRRISLLEQRFYSLELSINRLQQAAVSQRSTGTQSNIRDAEFNLIREELRRVTLQLAEIECGLLKLDERTARRRDARSSSETRPADPCRVNPDAPLRLSTRP